MFKIRFKPKAREDINEAQDFYESKQEGLGDKFTDDWEEKLFLLRRNPEMYAKFLNDIRRGHLSKFPYSFYYQPDIPQELVHILMVVAQAQDPEQIAKILEQRMDELD